MEQFARKSNLSKKSKTFWNFARQTLETSECIYDFNVWINIRKPGCDVESYMRENIEEADIASGKQAMSIEDPTTSYSMTMFKLYFSDIFTTGVSYPLCLQCTFNIYYMCIENREDKRFMWCHSAFQGPWSADDW